MSNKCFPNKSHEFVSEWENPILMGFCFISFLLLLYFASRIRLRFSMLFVDKSNERKFPFDVCVCVSQLEAKIPFYNVANGTCSISQLCFCFLLIHFNHWNRPPAGFTFILKKNTHVEWKKRIFFLCFLFSFFVCVWISWHVNKNVYLLSLLALKWFSCDERRGKWNQCKKEFLSKPRKTFERRKYTTLFELDS